MKQLFCVWRIMEKKVNRIWPVSDPSTTYFLQIAWGKDISAGFDVMLSDSQSVWTGRVPEEEISREAADMEMEREKYVEELRKVLLFEGRLADKYSFDISKEGVNGESLSFSYEKNLKDVSVSFAVLFPTEFKHSRQVIFHNRGWCKTFTSNDNLRNSIIENYVVLYILVDFLKKGSKGLCWLTKCS
ncbi:hypothetical protein lerEdw1_000339 [Lerista edwardsae]|nr:hypothetical protein lerEdw1_000339 [Lerista edwardsae]